jgi:hypothetical protein
MKQSANLIPVLKQGALKLFFCSQLFIIILALPSLFYVGITYNSDSNDASPKKTMTMTTKGKKILAAKVDTVKYQQVI